MLDEASLIRALKKVAGIPWHTPLARRVPLYDLIKNLPPKFLWTSGKPNRFNLSGSDCIYFSDNEATAKEEYSRPLAGTPAGRYPVTTFWAEVSLRRVLDLTNEQVRDQLELSEGELFAGWRLAPRPTATQVLGETIRTRTDFSAICFPSDAARAAALKGVNLVIFRDQVKAPDLVKILGPQNEMLEVWS